ncbi:unnamed protein product [Scytosiphon promiscuus]
MFDVDGRKQASYCKQHAKDGMVNVVTRPCLHNS